MQHTIERIVLLNDEDQVTRQALLEAIESETPLIMTDQRAAKFLHLEIPPEGFSLDEGEKLIIKMVLEKVHWNKRRTCKILNISRPRLDRMIKKYNLSKTH